GGKPPPEPRMAVLPMTVQRLVTPLVASRAQNTPYASLFDDSSPPMMSTFESMRGWQSPTARTPSPRAPKLRDPPAISRLSSSQAAAPPQASSQAPTALRLPVLVPSPLMLLARTITPLASPLMRMPAALPCPCELHSALRATCAPGESSRRTA